MTNKKTYSEKLRDPRWQKKRLEILSRDEFTCRNCGDTETTLHVHHKYYERNLEPWEYPEEALITLCEICHESEEVALKEGSMIFMEHYRKSPFMAMDLESIGIAFQSASTPLCHVSDVVVSAMEYFLSTPELQREMVDRYFEYLRKRNTSAGEEFKDLFK